MLTTMNYIFWLRKNATSLKGLAPIYCRVTISGHRIELSTGLFCKPIQWSSTKGRVKGDSQEACQINQLLSLIDAELASLKLTKKVIPTKDELVAAVKGHVPNTGHGSLMTFANCGQLYLEDARRRKVQASTLKSLTSRVQKLNDWFSEQDMARKPVAMISNGQLQTLLDHLVGKHKPDYVHKVWQVLVGIIQVAIDKSQQTVRIFDGCILPDKETKDIVFLTTDELKAVLSYQPPIGDLKRQLERTRDLFLFQCYTGLAVSDLKKITASSIKEIDDSLFWSYTRQKTKQAILVPVLHVAKTVFDKYKGKGRLPTFSDPIYNKHLKTLAKEVGIEKDISSHVGRKTFATLLLNGNVPIETVKVVMGHSDERITMQHYAHVQAHKVASDFAKVGFIPPTI